MIWTKAEVSYLQDNYLTNTAADMAASLSRTTKSVQKKLYALGLRLPDSTRLSRQGSTTTWTLKEEQYLIENPDNLRQSQLAEVLNKTVLSIKMKRNHLLNKHKITYRALGTPYSHSYQDLKDLCLKRRAVFISTTGITRKDVITFKCSCGKTGTITRPELVNNAYQLVCKSCRYYNIFSKGSSLYKRISKEDLHKFDLWSKAVMGLYPDTKRGFVSHHLYNKAHHPNRMFDIANGFPMLRSSHTDFHSKHPTPTTPEQISTYSPSQLLWDPNQTSIPIIFNPEDSKDLLSYSELWSTFIPIFPQELRTKRSIIMSILRRRLSISQSRTVFARKLSVVSGAKHHHFIAKHHRQGHAGAKYHYALCNDVEVLAAMTFNPLRFTPQTPGHYELMRFCVHPDCHIPGAFSRLLKAFVREHSPRKVISYADRRFVNQFENVYVSNRFSLVSVSRPNYFYSKHPHKVLHSRVAFQKHKLQLHPDTTSHYSIDLTEKQIMTLAGYDIWYDMGNLKYEIEYFKQQKI